MDDGCLWQIKIIFGNLETNTLYADYIHLLVHHGRSGFIYKGLDWMKNYIFHNTTAF